MCDLNVISLNQLRLWTPEALRAFLTVRKKSIEGTFDELVARAYAALESSTPVDQDAENRERLLLAEYRAKLCQDGEFYPDPFTIEGGWEGEETGRFLWPGVHYADISAYLQQTAPSDINLRHRLLNEYKEGKAYRYYTCERVREVKYHAVRPKSPLCFLSASVYPSMTTKRPYSVWVMAVKKTSSNPGGAVRTAYCTCPAGLLGSCNHIAGLLFRVEGAVKAGATEKSATEESCQWNIPRGTVGRRPQPVQESLLHKDKYFKKQAKEQQAANLSLKRQFVPYSESQAAQLADVGKVRSDLEKIIASELPDCVFVRTRQNLPPPPPKSKVDSHAPEDETVPLDLVNIGLKCHTVSALRDQMKLTAEEIAVAERKTRSQATSEEWHRYRLGRLTSSRFYTVHTRMRPSTTPNPQQAENLTTFAKTFVEKRSAPKVAAIKHGTTLEATAKASVKEALEERHTNCEVRDCGLTISEQYPFLGASPDLHVHCDCCGDSVVEIKCPYAIRTTKPTVSNTPYLILDENNEITLKKKHVYYGQIQGQLAITDCALCHLFVFTEHGHLLVAVKRDQEFWNSMLPRLEVFWTTYVAPLLLGGASPAPRPAGLPMASASTHLAASSSKDTAAETPSQRKSRGRRRAASPFHSDIPATSASARSSTSTDTPAKTSSQRTRGKKRATSQLAEVYLCGSCGMAVVDSPRRVADSSVKCDKCPLWYHIRCVGIPEKAIPGENDPWECPKCTESDSD